MNTQGLTRQRSPRVLWCVFVFAATMLPIYAQSSSDPLQLQTSGIARMNHWLDYARTTGDTESTASELVAARSELQASYDLFLKQQNFAGASLSAIKIADTQRLQNQGAQAVPIYKDAVELAQRAKRADYQTKALTLLAFSELNLDDANAAADHIREALRLGAKCGNKVFYFGALDTAAEIELKRNNLVAAGEYLDRALAMSSQIDDKRQLYLGYADRGDIYYQVAAKCDYAHTFDVCYQSLELARADYEKAIALSHELGFEFVSQIFQGELQDVNERKVVIQKTQGGDQMIAGTKMFSPQSAKDVLVTELFAPGGLDANTLAAVAKANQQIQDWQTKLQQQGLIVPDINPSDLFRQGTLAQAQGNDDAALEKYLQAVDLLEKDRRNLRDEQERGAFMEDKVTYYYNPATLLLDRKQYAEAFALFERSRSRAMADLLASRPLTLGTVRERTLFSELETAKTNIAAQQEKLFNLTGSQDRDQHTKEILQLESQIADLQQQYDQIEIRITKEAPRLKELTASEPVTLANLQRAAAQGGYDVLYYVVQNAGLILWHVNGDGVQVKNVFLPQSELIKKTTALRDSLVARRDSPEAIFNEEISRELFLYLIQPVLSSIRSNHLIIVPQEELNSIPFQALQNPETKKYLGESFAISYAPSATVLATLDNNSPLRNGRLLAIADPEIHDAAEEVNAIGKLYPGRSKMVTQGAVNKADVNAWVSHYNVVHLSVHGEFDASDPLLSYLQFKAISPDNGRLTAAEMFGLPLQKDSLVVLSACETGRVETTHANEVMGMVRSLLYAGAGSLVLSSWEVNAASTKLWMETFYKEGQTNSPTEAARRALVAVKSRPEYSHPFFWAPFVMTGK